MMILQMIIHWDLIRLQHALWHIAQLRSWCGIRMVHLPAHRFRLAEVHCNIRMVPGVMYPEHLR